METIWKFEIRLTDTQEISVPEGANFISAQYQHGKICLWAVVNSENKLKMYKVSIKGTGHPISPEEMKYKYVGTVQQYDGQLVWHILVNQYYA